MNIIQIEKKIREVFIHNIEYWKEKPDYMAEKEQIAEMIAKMLGLITNRPINLEKPANLTNLYRIQCMMTDHVGRSRFTLEFDTIAKFSPVISLEILISVIASVAEVTWHVNSIEDQERQHKFLDLFDQQWLATHPEYQAIASQVKKLIEQHNYTILPLNITSQPALTDLPTLFPDPITPLIRHYLFEGSVV